MPLNTIYLSNGPLLGTPIENSALDLWTIFRFLMPGLLGSRKDLEKSLSVDSLKNTFNPPAAGGSFRTKKTQERCGQGTTS